MSEITEDKLYALERTLDASEITDVGDPDYSEIAQSLVKNWPVKILRELIVEVRTLRGSRAKVEELEYEVAELKRRLAGVRIDEEGFDG